MTAWRQLAGFLARFLRAREGVAAVEFALILPVMLLVYVGTMEASALISMDRRVQIVSGTVGDLVARSDGKVTTAELNNYFNAATGIMQPFSSARLAQVVTSVFVKADGTTQVKWSQPYHGGVAKAVGASYPLPAEITGISRGKFVIVSEATYAYVPLMGIVIDQPINLYRQNFYLPRFGQEITCCS